MQALERSTGYVETDSGKIVRGFKSIYKRHGTLNLFAALQVATGGVHTEITTLKRRVEFLDFMDKVIHISQLAQPSGSMVQYHVPQNLARAKFQQH
jgi:hypothetical protein